MPVTPFWYRHTHTDTHSWNVEQRTARPLERDRERRERQGEREPQTEEQEGVKQGKPAEGNKNRAPDKETAAGEVQENSVAKYTLIKSEAERLRKHFLSISAASSSDPLDLWPCQTLPGSRSGSSVYTRHPDDSETQTCGDFVVGISSQTRAKKVFDQDGQIKYALLFLDIYMRSTSKNWGGGVSILFFSHIFSNLKVSYNY